MRKHDEIENKRKKLRDYYIRLKIREIERDGKKYKEMIVKFVKKEEIQKRADKMTENMNIDEAGLL
jgi:hypothetical protein